jgi:copper chaperone CopZ
MNTSGSKPAAYDCCAPKSPTSAAVDATTTDSGGKGILAVVGALLAALLASACCWLPLALVAMGASAVGISATFDRWRPLMLGVTAVFLAVGFYLAYRPQRCAPGAACATVSPTRQRGIRVSLWIATALVAGVASFPWWSPLVISSLPNPAVATNSINSSMPTSQLMFTINGMTCAACAATLQRGLQSIPGVIHASVSYNDKTAAITWMDGQISREKLLQQAERVVQADGYLISPSPVPQPEAAPHCCP